MVKSQQQSYKMNDLIDIKTFLFSVEIYNKKKK